MTNDKDNFAVAERYCGVFGLPKKEKIKAGLQRTSHCCRYRPKARFGVPQNFAAQLVGISDSRVAKYSVVAVSRASQKFTQLNDVGVVELRSQKVVSTATANDQLSRHMRPCCRFGIH